ncbi:hypothetical protein DH2020_007542 [Rehmannia glutinosa]|uniref:Retrotransposon Copia-like N-terminal domain-containing protein n=1 Tax=Rehmannia glutinosa TaxID=99300 RepID=A0ABR0TYH3_REHGL
MAVNAPNPADDFTLPYFLHPSDNPSAIIDYEPFTRENYVSWSRSVVVALNVKNETGFIDGSLPMPSLFSSPILHSCWQRANNLVLFWILNSISKDIRQSLLYFNSTQEVWEELKTRYVRSDCPRVFQLERSLSSISQGNNSIATYYNQFKGLWDEYISFRPIPKCSCGQCNCNIPFLMAATQQSDSIMKFLVGLYESYAPIRNQLLLTSPLPYLAKAYYLLLQEEAQRGFWIQWLC